VFATFKANLWQSQRVCLCLPAKVGDRWVGGWIFRACWMRKSWEKPLPLPLQVQVQSWLAVVGTMTLHKPKNAEALNEMTSLQGKPRLVKGTPPDLQTPGGGKAESGQRDADWDSY